MMLRGIPHSWISRDFRVVADDGDVADVAVRWLRESASFRLGGESYEVRRQGLVRPSFVLERAGAPVAHATLRRMLLPSFDVRSSDRRLTLRAVSPLGRRLRVFHGDRPIGAVTPRSPFSRVALAELPEDLSMPERVFLIHLAMVIWNRRRAAAAAGG